MFTRGYAKHPCTQHVYSQGFAVGRVENYRCVPIRLQGGSLVHTRIRKYSRIQYPCVQP